MSPENPRSVHARQAINETIHQHLIIIASRIIWCSGVRFMSKCVYDSRLVFDWVLPSILLMFMWVSNGRLGLGLAVTAKECQKQINVWRLVIASISFGKSPNKLNTRRELVKFMCHPRKFSQVFTHRCRLVERQKS